MRDYLYIWIDPAERRIVASGIEFQDISHLFEVSGGLLLLEHKADEAERDPQSWFEYLPAASVHSLQSDNLHSWGNFCWADYNSPSFPTISKQETAELLYFGHRSEVFNEISMPSLGNRFLTKIHDDGWYFSSYYSDWKYALQLLSSLPALTEHPEFFDALRTGEGAYWIADGKVDREERTLDIDAVLSRRFP